MAILFNSHLCKHWILDEDQDSLCPITTKALAFRRNYRENFLMFCIPQLGILRT